MKRSIVIIIILTLISMTGCLVSSLHPFFKQKDKYFDPAMVGNWIDEDSCIWTIEPDIFKELIWGEKKTDTVHHVTYTESFPGDEKMDSTYSITYYEDHNSKAELTATLFQLNGVSYVDFAPDPDGDHSSSGFTSWHHIPVHTLARVQCNKESILIYWYGDDWLNELFEQKRIRIKHETIESLDYDRHVLTASTDELQKFIKKYANDPKTIGDIENIFARGYTDDQDEYGVFLKLKPYDGPIPEQDEKQVRSN
ncbi:MAG: hypothetical protein ABFS38_17530 [Bacteroidota bacterium]